ncbi:SDR family oxidoreductase [Metabacillus halosaccharovorans]|uniref:SDR family oxidoreductase n=1 Tax=Metabacillus halosaccharovorans TaxID=930124 RepID=UPI002040D694|nr:SDR family oxidoreductase [Metabacillus halosaccharovorans]MCM3444100.1 SDR family oxidoreductase [Metabacillus halosaccharovorans]
MRILVTGSTGKLGSALLHRLESSGYKIKLTSRRKPERMVNGEWVYSDLLSGEGLEEAVKDVDVIIHAATSPVKHSKIVEVSGFKEFLGKMQHIKNIIYPSIVGIDDIPFTYYKKKLEAEELLRKSAIPHTIVRSTQFHHFVENIFLSKPFFSRYIVPGNFKFQSVDVNEFAKHLIGLVEEEPQGRIADFAGPEILTLKEMAELKININNESNKVLSIALPGKLSKSFSEGKNTNPLQKHEGISFEEYLRDKVNETLLK